jgi:hypothetical protein
VLPLNGHSFAAFAVTDAGMKWLDQNEGQLTLRVTRQPRVDPRATDDDGDDIPF